MLHRSFHLVFVLLLLNVSALAAQTIVLLDADGAPTGEILAGDAAKVRLVDAAANADPGYVDSAYAEATSLYGAGLEYVNLVETGPDTGVFEGTLQLASPFKVGLTTTSSGAPDYFPDEVTLDYGSGVATAMATVLPARLRLLDDDFGLETLEYALGQNVRVRLEEHLQNDPSNLDSVSVYVASLTTGDTEILFAEETGFDTGIFEASVATTSTPGFSGDGVLSAQVGETLRSTYYHYNDPGMETADATVRAVRIFLLDAQGQPAPTYMEGSTAYLRVVDSLADTLPGTPDTVNAVLQSQITGDLESVLLTETGASTGAFEGSIRLSVDSPVSLDGLLQTAELGGPPHQFDTLIATMDEESVPETATATAMTTGSTVAFLDAYGNEVTAYAVGAALYVRVVDAIANYDPGYYDSTVADLYALTGGDNEQIALFETGLDTGVFEASVPLGTGPPTSYDGILQADSGDTVEARHDDYFGYTQATDQAAIQDVALYFIDAAGIATGEVLEGDVARIRLLSLGDNSNPGAVDSLSLQIESLYGGDVQSVAFTETGADTSVFEGGVQLASLWELGLYTSNSGSPSYLPDVLTVRYPLAGGGEVSASATTRGARLYLIDAGGQVTSSYGLGEAIRIRAIDHYVNDPYAVDSFSVPVTSTLGSGDSESVLLTETGFDTGVFEGQIATSSSGTPGDGLLGVAVGETVATSYDHGYGFNPETAQAQVAGSAVYFLDASGAATATYMEASTAYVRVVDPLADFSPSSPDTVSVALDSFFAGDYETLVLTETGNSTGVFEGSIPLDVRFFSLGDGLLATSEFAGPPHRFDTLTVSYDDQSGTTSTATAETTGSLVVLTDADGNEVTSYAAGSTLYVRVVDPTANSDPSGYETTGVELYSLAGGDYQQLTLLETGFDTGVFEGSLPLGTGPVTGYDGVLQADSGDTVEARHDDYFGYTQAQAQASIIDVALFFIDASGVVTSEVLEGDVALMRLLSQGDNADPGTVDQLSLQVDSLYGGGSQWVDFTETGADTGVFEGGVQLASPTKTGLATSNSGSPNYFPDVVTVRYPLPGGEASASATTRGSRIYLIDGFGQVTSSYGLSEPVRVRIVDHNLNDPLQVDTWGAELTTLVSGDIETLTVTETGFDTGVFEGEIAVTSSSTTYDGLLGVSVGETVVATHNHYNDPGQETAQAQITGSAAYFLDASGEVTATYMEASTAYLRVVDPLADSSPSSPDTVSVMLDSFFAGDYETLLLTETGNSTGVFEGSIPLDVQFFSLGDGLLATSEFAGPPHRFDTLTVSYGDQSGTTSTATAETTGSLVVLTDANGNEVTGYAAGSTLYVRVVDPTANSSSSGYETTGVELYSLAGGDYQQLTLLETGFDTGVFEGSLPLGTGPVTSYDGILQADSGDTVEARHDDYFGYTQAQAQALVEDVALFFIDASGVVTSEVLEGDVARMRLLSQGDNPNPGTVDQLILAVDSLYGGGLLSVYFTETGADTGVFEGQVQLASPSKAGLATSNSGWPEYLPDVVTVRYPLPGGEVSASATTRGSRIYLIDGFGQVTSSYGLSEPVRVRIVDHNLNDPLQIDIWGAELTTLGSGDYETLTVTETGFDTGVFEGEIPVTSSSTTYDGLLGVSLGETVVATHNHSNDPGQETAQAQVTGSAAYFLDAAGEVTSTYREASTAYVRVVDPLADTSPSSPDTVSVALDTLFAGDYETLVLTETDNSTGVFEGSIPLDVRFFSLGDGLLATSEFTGPPHRFDTLTVSYDDQSGTTSTASAETTGSLVVLTDANGNEVTSYAAGSTLYVRVVDPTANSDSSGYETTGVELYSLAGGDYQQLTLLETGFDTGVFEGSLPLGTGPVTSNDGVLQADSGDTVEARHDDYFGYTQAQAQASIVDVALFFIDASGVITSEVLEGDVAHIRLLAEGYNFDPGTVDQVTRQVDSLYGGDVQTVYLMETGADTGVFEGAVQLASPTKVGLVTSNSGSPEYLPDMVTVRDPLPGGEVSASAVTRGSRIYLIDGFGQVTSSYGLSEPVRVRIVDHNRNNPIQIDTWAAELTTLLSGDNETLTVTETGFDTGVFEGEIAVTSSSTTSDGLLGVSLGETVVATHAHYNDPGLETAQAQITGSAAYFVDAAGEVTATYREASTAYVRIVDPLADSSPSSPDTVSVALASFFAGDYETLVLTETGNSTGVFEGSIPLDVQFFSLGDGLLASSELAGPPHRFDTLTVSYDDQSGTTSTATAETTGSLVVLTDVSGNEVTSYAAGSTLYVRVVDPTANSDPYGYETTGVELISLAGGDYQQLTLLETGFDTGVFEGSLPLGTGPVTGYDGVLQALSGDTVEARHDDYFGYTQAYAQALVEDVALFFIDASGVVTSEVLEGDVARMRLLSDGDNANPGTVDQLSLQVDSLYGGGSQSVDFTETGADTGVFEGGVQLASPTKAGLVTTNSGSPQYLPDVVTVRYPLPGGDVTASAVTRGSRIYLIDSFGQVTSSYGLSEPVRVRIVDHNLNDPTQIDAWSAELTSTLGSGDNETVSVTETGLDTGVFEGEIAVTSSSTWSDGLLGVGVGETVTATHLHYNDPGQETAQAQITGSAAYFLDAAGEVTSTYMEASTAYLRIVDPLADSSPSSPDTVSVALDSFFAGDYETLVLTETGNSTGVFEGSIPLDVQFFSQGDGLLASSEFAGPPHRFDTLTVRYDDPSGTTSTATAETTGSVTTFVDASGNGVTSYVVGTTLYVRVEDATANSDPFTAELTGVQLFNLPNGDMEALTLQETGNNTDVFEASLPLGIGSATLYDGILQADEGETIEARHDDFFGYTQSTAQASIAAGAIFFVDAGGTVVAEVLEGDIAHLRLLAPGTNADPGLAEQVGVTLSSLYGGDSQAMTLTETGPDTGLFEGQYPLASPFQAGLATGNSGAPQYLADQLSARYSPGAGADVVATATTVAARAAFVDFLGQPVTVSAQETYLHPQVEDHNVNNPATVDSVIVTVSSPATGDVESVTLTETGADTAIFTGSLQVSGFGYPSENGVLEATGGQNAVASHSNYNDPGTTQAIVLLTANLAPVPMYDIATANLDQAVTVDVLANDYDPESGPLSVIAVGEAGNGSVVLNGDQTVTYTPNPGFTGSDTFTYILSDAQGGQAETFVYVTINLPPVVSIYEPSDGEVLVYGLVSIFSASGTDPEQGDMSSSIEWSSDLDGALGSGAVLATDTLSAGVHTITASLVDSQGASDSDSITVTVNQEAVVTITSPADGLVFTEGAEITFTGTALDPEDGDLTAGLVWLSNVDGVFGTGGTVATSTLSAGLHSVTAYVTDSHGTSGTTTIQVTVNVAPTVAITAPADGSVFTQGTSVGFTGTATDPEDGDLAASLAWSSSLDGAIGTGASVSTSALSAGIHTITASVTDSHGAPGSAAITVTINVVPTVAITSPADGSSSTETDPVTFTATATDPEDGNLAASLVWTSTLDGAIGSGGSFVISSLSIGTHTITASVTDSHGAPGSAAITVTVNPNTAPVVTILSPSDGQNVTVGDLVTFTGSAVDAQDGDLSAALTWTSSLDGVLGTGSSVATSSLSLGSHTITASVTDSHGAPGAASITILVRPQPVQVTFTSIGSEDGRIEESSENSNVGGKNDSVNSTPSALRVGDDRKDKQYKSVVSFDTSSIPDGAEVQSVTLRLVRGTVDGTDPFTTHGSCRVDIRTGGFNGSTSLEDADFEAPASAAQVATMSSPAADGDFSEGVLDAAGLLAVNKTGTTQLRIYFDLDDNNDGDNDYMGFHSGDDNDPNVHPQLVVIYQE